MFLHSAVTHFLLYDWLLMYCRTIFHTVLASITLLNSSANNPAPFLSVGMRLMILLGSSGVVLWARRETSSEEEPLHKQCRP